MGLPYGLHKLLHIRHARIRVHEDQSQVSTALEAGGGDVKIPVSRQPFADGHLQGVVTDSHLAQGEFLGVWVRFSTNMGGRSDNKIKLFPIE